MTIGYAKLTNGIILKIEALDIDKNHLNTSINGEIKTIEFRLLHIISINNSILTSYDYTLNYDYDINRNPMDYTRYLGINLKKESINKLKSENIINKTALIVNCKSRIIHFIIGNMYNECLTFFISREMAFHKNFMVFKEWEFFNDGYSGIHKVYTPSGYLIEEKSRKKYKHYINDIEIYFDPCFYN